MILFLCIVNYSYKLIFFAFQSQQSLDPTRENVSPTKAAIGPLQRSLVSKTAWAIQQPSNRHVSKFLNRHFWRNMGDEEIDSMFIGKNDEKSMISSFVTKNKSNAQRFSLRFELYERNRLVRPRYLYTRCNEK